MLDLLQSFFGRSYNNFTTIAECKNGNICVINRKNRTACKACRLQKCLVVGMSKSSSRYGRRSNWFKIHCFLQEDEGNQNVRPEDYSTSKVTSCLSKLLPRLPASSTVPSSHDQQQPGNQHAENGQERTSTSQADLVLRAYFLQDALLKRGQQKKRLSYQDDVTLQNQLRLLAWQKERQRDSSNSRTQQSGSRVKSLKESTLSPSSRNQQEQQQHSSNSLYAMNFPQNSVPSTSSTSMQPLLQSYQRTAYTPSNGDGASIEGGDAHHNIESLSYMKNSIISPALSEQGFQSMEVDTPLTFATAYQHSQNLGLSYSVPGLITPTISQLSPRGGDLSLVSPSPGCLAVKQDEPIDLSVKASKMSIKDEVMIDIMLTEELTARSNPLDLTLGEKSPEHPSLT